MNWTQSEVKERTRNVKLEVITVGPSEHDYCYEWFREFRKLSGLNLEMINQFGQDVDSLDTYDEIKKDSFDSWFKSGGRYPSRDIFYQTWLALILGVCEDEALASKWHHAFEKAKDLPRTPKQEKITQLNGEQENNRNTNQEDVFQQEPPVRIHSKHRLIASIAIVVVLIPIIWTLIFTNNLNEQIDSLKERSVKTERDRTQALEPLDMVDKDDLDRSAEDSDSRIPGLLNKIYLFADEYKTPPAGPTGIVIGEQAVSDVNVFDFHQLEMSETMSSMINNSNVGSYYEGQIVINQPGAHILSLDYKAGHHLVNQLGRECRIAVKLGEGEFDEKVPIGLGEEINLHYPVNLEKGYNRFSFWIGCEDLRGYSAKQHLRALLGSKVSLSLKSPKDRQPVVVSSGAFSRLAQSQ